MFAGKHFFSLLTLIFITLKLTSVIDWSWWFVLGPVWMPTATVVCIFAPIWLVFTVIQAKKEKKIVDCQADQEEQNTIQGFDDDVKH
jgi:hypothetical protein